MSVIGPRPLLVEYLPYYTKEEHHRHDVIAISLLIASIFLYVKGNISAEKIIKVWIYYFNLLFIKSFKNFACQLNCIIKISIS